MHQGVAQELHIERNGSRGLVGNVYMGKVVRILPGMQSAFIDVGLERTAFLHVADILEARSGAGSEDGAADRAHAVGRTEPDGAGNQGSDRHQGRAAVDADFDRRPDAGLSAAGEAHRRLAADRGRSRARKPARQADPAGAEDETGGFIVRTMAEGASEEDLANDIAYLRKKLGRAAHENPDGAPVYPLSGTQPRPARADFVNRETARIVIDSRENFQKLTRFSDIYTPAVRSLLEHYTGERPLFDLFGVEDEIQKALARRVDLKSGGYLIIDQTEAMTTIGVNTGGFVGVRNFDDTIFKTNLEAAQTIARQLRLRNLGGIIIIDFIDMDGPEHREAVLAEFNKALARDHTRLTVNGFTALGLVEMTRKRTANHWPTCSVNPARPATAVAR